MNILKFPSKRPKFEYGDWVRNKNPDGPVSTDLVGEYISFDPSQKLCVVQFVIDGEEEFLMIPEVDLEKIDTA